MSQNPDCIEIAIDIIAQLSQFFTRISSFSVNVVKVVCNKPPFSAYNWNNGQVHILFYLIEVHIEVDKSVYNYYYKALRLINKIQITNLALTWKVWLERKISIKMAMLVFKSKKRLKWLPL